MILFTILIEEMMMIINSIVVVVVVVVVNVFKNAIYTPPHARTLNVPSYTVS